MGQIEVFNWLKERRKSARFFDAREVAEGICSHVIHTRRALVALENAEYLESRWMGGISNLRQGFRLRKKYVEGKA